MYGALRDDAASRRSAPDAREALDDRAAAAFRPIVFAAIEGLLISGLLQPADKPGHRPVYHMLFGIKMLLALHVFAVAILIARPKNPRRTRA